MRLQVTRETAPPGRPAAGLSPRELEIARMVGLGHTNKRIAAVLEISGWTVSAHVRRIFDKLGVSSRAAMIATLSGDPALSWTTDRERPLPAEDSGLPEARPQPRSS
ncbi:helix-turn-helix domain-containing protein [Actinomycetospora sp. CA-101289]|uniref:helix-turn-helix domain-containing protein n=1 Tax=Actinomycetospora sp. CA-101289 TaxID=3239893 RepID=UPI003D98C3DA